MPGTSKYGLDSDLTALPLIFVLGNCGSWGGAGVFGIEIDGCVPA